MFYPGGSKRTGEAIGPCSSVEMPLTDRSERLSRSFGTVSRAALFEAQGLDRLEAGRLTGRVVAEEDTGRRGDRHRKGYGL